MDKLAKLSVNIIIINAQPTDLCRASLTLALNDKKQAFIFAIKLLYQLFWADVACINKSILTRAKYIQKIQRVKYK